IDLHISTDDEKNANRFEPDLLTLPLLDMTQTQVGELHWEPHTPARGWLTVMIPGLIGLFIIVTALAWRVFNVWRETLLNLLAHEKELCEARDTAQAASLAKTSFLAHMSHELRTPLNAIIGFSSIMTEQLMGPIGSQKYRGYAQDIQRTSRHLLSLIDEVLDLAQLDSTRAELRESCFPAGDALSEALRLARGEFTAVNFIEQLGESETTLILADRIKIVQILTNLLSNAAKASGDGGNVHAVVDRLPSGDLRFAISDTGRGLGQERDRASLEGLMVPFSRGTTAPVFKSGYGIGLSVSRRLADLHQAKLTLENRAGGGVLASLVLPVDRIRTGVAELPSAS
ncbi:MAG: HAMP domain-containing histidine kinase, partial [Rhodobacteraceae bacterium]|nr:HAMP domain-containing histidine kinase [Paracoccaceae bacterium]